MKLSFTGGVLECCCAYALRTDGMFSDAQIHATLLKSL
jgi:hypothetical protein